MSDVTLTAQAVEHCASELNNIGWCLCAISIILTMICVSINMRRRD